MFFGAVVGVVLITSGSSIAQSLRSCAGPQSLRILGCFALYPKCSTQSVRCAGRYKLARSRLWEMYRMRASSRIACINVQLNQVWALRDSVLIGFRSLCDARKQALLRTALMLRSKEQNRSATFSALIGHFKTGAVRTSQGAARATYNNSMMWTLNVSSTLPSQSRCQIS